MSDPSDIWKCSVRKCGWEGTKDQLDYQDDPCGKFTKITSQNGCCPKCGQYKKGFYVKKPPAPPHDQS